jgi:2-keto-4-pentenoate hydratase/2-oxohepta-3-ene-1,7-dioic acid hydratase in catechol pathway
MNYASHAEEMGLEVPAMPAAFAKFRSALTGPVGDITLPSDSVDYEVELVLVIGRRTEAVTPQNAWEHVAGITAGQDFSERTVQMAAGRQFALGKSYPGFAATGPWMSTIDEFADPADIGLGCSIDGVQVQDARSSDMIIKIPELLTILSGIITLEPGDLLYTGCPAGVGMGKNPPTYLKAGQELVTWVEGVGEMRHTMV